MATQWNGKSIIGLFIQLNENSVPQIIPVFENNAPRLSDTPSVIRERKKFQLANGKEYALVPNNQLAHLLNLSEN